MWFPIWDDEDEEEEIIEVFLSTQGYQPPIDESLVKEPIAEESEAPCELHSSTNTKGYQPPIDESLVQEPTAEEIEAPRALQSSTKGYQPPIDESLVKELKGHQPTIGESLVKELAFDSSTKGYQLPIEESLVKEPTAEGSTLNPRVSTRKQSVLASGCWHRTHTRSWPLLGKFFSLFYMIDVLGFALTVGCHPTIDELLIKELTAEKNEASCALVPSTKGYQPPIDESLVKELIAEKIEAPCVLKRDMKTTMRAINRACMLMDEIVEYTYKIHDHNLPRSGAYHEIFLMHGDEMAEKTQIFGSTPLEEEPLYGLTYLPRKYKVAVAIPPSNDVDVFAHCCGFIAIIENGKLQGFKASMGEQGIHEFLHSGGHSRSQNTAQFCPKSVWPGCVVDCNVLIIATGLPEHNSYGLILS